MAKEKITTNNAEGEKGLEVETNEVDKFEIPKDPEKASEKITETGLEKKEAIEATVKDQKEVEGEVTDGEDIPEAEEVDVSREGLVKESERKIDEITGEVNYENMSGDELQAEWDKAKKAMDIANKNKDEEIYNINYWKIKEIEATREKKYDSELEKRDNFLKAQRGVDNPETKNYKNYQEFLKD